MWKLAENGSNIKPDQVDDTSSRIYVYVRKEFKEIPNHGEEEGTHWQYLEKKILKTDWEVYSDILSAQTDITDIQLALCELYERGN